MTRSELELGSELAKKIDETKKQIEFFQKYFDGGNAIRTVIMQSDAGGGLVMTFEPRGNLLNELRELLLKYANSDLAALEEEFDEL